MVILNTAASIRNDNPDLRKNSCGAHCMPGMSLNRAISISLKSIYIYVQVFVYFTFINLLNYLISSNKYQFRNVLKLTLHKSFRKKPIITRKNLSISLFVWNHPSAQYQAAKVYIYNLPPAQLVDMQSSFSANLHLYLCHYN